MVHEQVQIDGEERGTYIWRDKDAITPDPCELDDEQYKNGLALAQGYLDTVSTHKFMEHPRYEILRCLHPLDVVPWQQQRSGMVFQTMHE